jgi:hypothetical protein
VAAKRIPPNLFGIPFGLTGLGGSWLTMAHYGLAPRAVGDALLAVAALVWITVLVGYLALTARSVLTHDLLDPIAGPFASLAVITPMLLAAQGLYPHAPGLGRVLHGDVVGAGDCTDAEHSGLPSYQGRRLWCRHWPGSGLCVARNRKGIGCVKFPGRRMPQGLGRGQIRPLSGPDLVRSGRRGATDSQR